MGARRHAAHNRLFEYSQIAQEFFPLLRSWYEEARRDTEKPCLVEAYTKVVVAQSISLDPIEAYKLDSLGLIRYEGDRIKPRCELYCAYFEKQLFIID